MNFNKLLFPYDKVRDIQEDLILKINESIIKGKNFIAHAPTGLGKTAAVLAPALKYALENEKTVFFLTSRHTQHKIAIETLAKIKNKYKEKFYGISIIGKKGLCLQSDIHKLYNSEFNDYCKTMRVDKKCEFYENLKTNEKLSTETKIALSELKIFNQITTENSLDISKKFNLCPYEISMLIAKNAKVIIGDYYYIFHQDIRNLLLNKINKELKNSIIIVDEAHNLPNRVKDLFTARLSNSMINRALSEAKKFKYDQIIHDLLNIEEILKELSNFKEDEQYINKELFIEKINNIRDYQELIEDFSFIGDAIREEQKQSYIGSIASFLESWLGNNEGFTRIISKKVNPKPIVILSYRCLDSSLATKEVIDEAHSTIMMSGTLTPTSMYNELLGFNNPIEETYKSPFPDKNRLNIIIPKTTTKYEFRNQKQYQDIATILANIVNIVPGNSAVFFPSYYLRDSIYKEFNELCKKTLFIEHPNLSKTEKHKLLEKFKSYKNSGAVLLGAISGSFGEGIDLPGDFLKAVVIVGLPLTKPDLESNALIDYYDKKFGKGWDYGYLFPAFNKSLQSAGRCIRSESDKGVVIFLDERYTWKNYYRCFPSSWNLKISLLYERLINEFFSKKI